MMERLKRIGMALLFPKLFIVLLLTPISICLTVYALAFAGAESIFSYIIYALSAYDLLIVSVRVPEVIRLIKSIRETNGLLKRWREDAHFRIKVSLYGSVIFGSAYALFQLGLGFYNHSLWFFSLSVYYFVLVIVRLYLLLYTRANRPGERFPLEVKKYTVTGALLLLLNLALTTIMFFIVGEGKTFIHHEITTITLAAYSFTSLTFAIINLVKYRRYNSPVFSAAKAVGLAAALVSLLTTETAMLTAFGGENEVDFSLKMMGATGAAVELFILGMAVYMLVSGIREMKKIKSRIDKQ